MIVRDGQKLKVRPFRAEHLGMPTTSLASTVCSSCGTTVVALQLGHGLRLHSCSHCDRRQWLCDGQPAALDQILALVGEASGKRRLVTTA